MIFGTELRIKAHHQNLIAVGVSGKGRSLENLLAHQKQGGFRVGAVFSDKEECRALKVAREANLPVASFDFTTENVYPWLEKIQPNLVVLAGFLKKFPVRPGWERKIVNIHPALLPKYGGKGMYGLNVHREVLLAGETRSGASVHFVNAAYDEGNLVAQAEVDITGLSSEEDLAHKVFVLECQLLPAVVRDLLKNKLPLPNGGIRKYEFSESH